MKTRIWALGLVLMMALLVGANATTAKADSFTISNLVGCAGDTMCVSVIPTGTDPVLDIDVYVDGILAVNIPSSPWDDCFSVPGGAGPGLVDIDVVIHYDDGNGGYDSTKTLTRYLDYIVAMSDGVTVDENGTIGINVRMNDTTSTPDSAWIRVWPGDALPGSQEDGTITNGPDHGTIDSIVNNTVIWYTPDVGYNGTDDFVYSHVNECGDYDTALVAITIDSDGLLSIECGDLQHIDHTCDNDCGGTCDESTGGDAVSLGDSVRFCVNVAYHDLDELTSGWPRIDLPGIAGTNIVMQMNPNDSTEFCWPGFDADSTPAWYMIDDGSLDLVENIYEIIVRARSSSPPNLVSACTTLVDQAIDNEGPEIGAGEASWTLWQDVDGNGIVTTLDTMRLFIDLRNEPFEEICQVSVTLYGFPSVDDTGSLAETYCMYEIAGDNRWAVVLTGMDLAGDLEDVDGPFTAVFHYWDNACNQDSVDTQYNGPVDNTMPDCDCIEWVYEAVDDLDENGCIGLGESVRISVRDTCNGDVSDFYIDLFSDDTWRLGLGSDDPADSSHQRFLLPSIGGGWYGVEWVLGQYPLDNAIDTTAAEDVVPWVFLHAEDDAGNPLTCDSLQMNWTDIGINIDARAPSPVVLDSCVEAETFTGRRAVHVYFTDTANGPGFGDIDRFRMFYDNGTGVVDYVDTLAGLNWDDTLGGTGTDGLVRVGPNSFYWTTDGTVELSECRDYLFNIWVRDDCDNLESSHGEPILCMGERPDPITWIDCSSEDDLNICLEWQTSDAAVDSFCIFMASDGVYDTAVWVATVDFSGDIADTFFWCTDDAGLDLIEYRWYDFIVLSYDSCGNVQEEEAADEFIDIFVAQCFPDLAPPVVCVFQPESLSDDADTTIYSGDHCSEFLPGGPETGMWIYTRPCNDTSLDVRQVDSVLVRMVDSSGSVSDWYPAGFNAKRGPNHWAIKIHTEFLNWLVQTDDSVEVLQVMVVTTDAAGRTSTREQIETCCGYFEFVWSAYVVEIIATEVDGNVQTYQPYCNAHGFDVSGGGMHEVEVCITGGTAPFKIRASAAPSGEQWADENYHQVVYVENVYARCTTLSFSTEGWAKGLGELDVEVCDAAGHYDGENEIALCVDDEIPPCALITNPVDGKCIRRSISMIDPVEICMTIDPAGIGLDNENILKVDFQWSQDCCTGFVVDTVCFDTACPPPAGFPEGSVCTTYANPNSAFFGQTFCHPIEGGGNPVACTVYADGANGLDSTICWEAQADTTCRITVCRLREVPCESVFEWKTFGIVPGHRVNNDYCVDWWNTEDLAWVTESGTIIYLRAIVYDEQGNQCISPCVQVCVDIDTPPLCLWTPDICPSNGYMAIGGNEDHEVTFVAELDLAQGNVDDLEDVTLWYKKSTDPDLLDYWYNVGSGFFGPYNDNGTNSSVWRWDLDIDDLGLQDGISYDWRVIGHTIWGTTSWDYTGDGNFDHNTFDSSGCDMNTYYIDITAPQVAMDTVWTTVNGEPIVQPNVSCALSDPRGWAWTQFGNEMTVQPSVYPWTGQGPEYLNFKDDVKRVRWTLFDDTHNCECDEFRGDGDAPFPVGSCFDDECDCEKGGNGDYCDYDGTSNKSYNGYEPWVVADLGTIPGQNPMQNLTFNPADAPWWDDNWSGVQTAVLLVEVWDSCGNRTQDCITLYLLDADPTDAIIVEPMNGEVFCTAPGGEAYGGIEIRSGSILEEGWNKAVYAYRAVGSSDWIEFDSVGFTQDEDETWSKGWTEVTWNPVAMGLPNGSYELTVWAVDNSLNRSTNLYIITVHLSCSAPTVALVYPTSTDPAFVGCPIELEAVATSDDPVNPITEVEFYYVSVIEALDEATYIGSDYNSVDGRWGYFWDEPNFEGPHYIFAIAYNLSGQSSTSELVWVKGDDTEPWAEIIQVGDDLNPDDDGDDTPIPYGSTVTLYGKAYDNDADWGYDEVDNCGVDSVIFYVYDNSYNRVAGFLATPDDIIDSLFTAEWTVVGDFPAGEYHVQMEVWDCACNSGSSDYWYVEITNPEQNPTLAVDGPEVCGYVSVDEYMDVTVTVNNPDFVESIYIAYSNSIYSDVEDQYEWFELYDDEGNDNGVFTGSVYVGGEEEGLYRVRAVIYYEDNTSTENGFDDFTFNDELDHHMMVRFDHSLTSVTITPKNGTTFKAHDDICFDLEAAEECDIDHMHICSADEEDHEGHPGGNLADSLDFCFDPVDSSCITLSNCGVWGGTVGVEVCDYFGHCEMVDVEFWVLDVAGPDTTLITSHSIGDYLTPSNSNVLTARKLSASGVDSVQFWRNAAQTGNGSAYIGSAVASGDEFSYEWDVEGVAEGSYYIFTRSFNNNVGKDGPRCVNITVAKGCESFALMAPNPSYTRTFNGQTVTFVGDRTDLCIDRNLITSITNGVGIDSVVWYFRQASAPGGFPEENDDPFAGYVRIASDRFGSLCIDWWTDWCTYGDSYGDDYYDWLSDHEYEEPMEGCCSDGRFTVVAYVYDKAGNVCHSVPTVVNIDNTDPYSEVVDIDGDETFGDCHPIVLPGDSVIKVTANAIDMTCSEGSPTQLYASGAKYLQFFAGGCGSSGASPLDILFVVDGSWSMRYGYYTTNNLNTIAAAAGTFTNALSGRNVQYGVIGYSGEVSHDDCEQYLAGQVMDTDGSPTYLCDGIWTSNPNDLTNMIYGIFDTELPYVGGQNDNNYEFGLQAIANGLDWYDWRPGATRVIILMTDEDDDPTALGFPNIDLSQIEQSGAVVYTIMNQTATTGYLTLAPNTGGQTYEINSNLGATFGALTSSILTGSNYDLGDVGIVWGKQVALTDGQDNAFALWNVSGLEPGEYCVWTKVIDQIGNVYESDRVSVCIEDHTPPTAYIAGFGKSTDDHMNHEYTIYGQSWDTDIDYVQFQYRPAGSTSQTDWTGIGVPIAVGCDGDNTLWMTKWNPCVLSGTFQMRVVPTDENGNQDHDIQPIANVTISNCDITPAAASASASAVWFEDKTFEDLGLVHLDMDGTADNYHNSMIAVWADLHGDLESECIDLYAPDPDQPAWLSGSFNAINSIKMGGEGWFWQAYTDNNNVTHLEKEVVTVWPVRADIGGCNSTHPTLGAKVCIEAGALSSDNGIIVFPARVPVVNWSQQHYQAWPAATSPRFQLVTAIRLTNPIDAEEGYYGNFNLGKYAKVTIKYREPALDNSDLTVGWWDGDQWNIEDGLLAADAVTDSSAAVYTTELHGLYAVVSAGRTCIPGALTVENAGMEKAVGNVTGPWPTIFTRVRSNIEFNNGNYDIDEDNIVVVLDGNTTLYSNGNESDWYDVWYDNTSGILTVDWYGPNECLTDDDYDGYGGGDSYYGEYAPALTAGTHTLYVQAFNDAGYCAENTYTFTVDRSSPNVEVVGYEDCANPTFHIKITDEGPAGVDWENVFVDVFDITGSEFDALPKSRLVHTETYDAFNEELDMETGEFSFQLVSHIAQGRRLRIVIYIGDRYIYYNNECNCEYVEYDHDCDGVQDLVGNRTQIVEEQYTIWGSSCSGGGDGDGSGDVTIQAGNGSGNPFDPWAGGSITFNLNGFDGGGAVSVEVFDVAGVKVADLSPGNISSTVGTVNWNGRNEDGEYVAQGVYLVHFASQGGQASGATSQVLKVVVKRGSTASN